MVFVGPLQRVDLLVYAAGTLGNVRVGRRAYPAWALLLHLEHFAGQGAGILQLPNAKISQHAVALFQLEAAGADVAGNLHPPGKTLVVVLPAATQIP